MRVRSYLRVVLRVLLRVVAVWAAVLATPAAVAAQTDSEAAASDDKFAAVRDKLATCVVCHGEAGASQNPQYPVLAGQHLHYLYVQLKDFKAGRRENAVMSPIASALEKKEMLLMAEYFSKQSWPALDFEAAAPVIAQAQKAAVAGQCVQCHRGGYEGDSRIPRLGGQHAEYAYKTMLDFKTRARNNSPSKSSLFASFEDADLKAMAEYLAGLKP